MARTEEDKLKAMQELNMMQTEEEALAGKFNKSIAKFAELDTDEMLAALREMSGEDAPSEEEIRKAAESSSK